MIQKLFLGETPRVNRQCKHPDYSVLNSQWLSLADQFEKQLSKEQIAILSQIMDLRDQCDDMMMAEAYETGFKDGARLIMDILKEDNTS